MVDLSNKSIWNYVDLYVHETCPSHISTIFYYKPQIKYIWHCQRPVHDLWISNTDTKTVPILLFIKYRNWYILSIRY